MKLVQIEPNEFNELVIGEPNKSFYQTANWGGFYDNLNCTTYYLGLVDDNNVYAALGLFIVEKGTLLSKKTATCPYGFLINYYDTGILKEFTNKIKKFLSLRGVGKLIINPNVPYLTNKGNNDLLIKNIEQLGYKKTNSSIIYTTKIDEVKKENSLKDIYLKAYEVNTLEEYKKLFSVNINYQYLHESMGNMAKFVVCELDVQKSIDKNNEVIADAKYFIDIHQDDYKYDTKRQNKAKLIEEKQNILNILNKYTKENDKKPLLAVTCLIEYNNKITQLFIDDKKECEIFNTLDVLNEKTLLAISKLGYESFDSYAQKTNSDITELIGEFTYRV